MKSLGAILFLLAPLLLLPQAAQAQGDTKIPFAATKPLDTNTQAVVDAGLAALATYDAGAAADITGAVNDGSLDIGELADARFNDFKRALRRQHAHCTLERQSRYGRTCC